MKKLFILTLLTILLSSSVFSYDIFDSSDEKRTYFSLANSDVIIKTSVNLSTIILTKDSISKNYSFSECDSLYCSEISLVDFMADNNLTLANSEFTLNANSEVHTIYLDIEDPNLDISNSIINNETKSLNIIFNHSDNNEVELVEIYEKIGSDIIFVQNASGNSFSKNLTEIGNVTLIFKIYDIAGNSLEKTYNFFIHDIFEPKIEFTELSYDSENYKLNFEVSDETLKKYEVIQGTLVLSENISGTFYETTINVPFETGNIILKVYDANNNVVIKTINLDSPIKNTFENKFSKDKIFQFTSNAEKCYLIGIDSNTYNEEFSKSGNDFSFTLNIDEVKEYNLEISCETEGFKESYDREFFYDPNKPFSTPQLEISKNDNGDLVLSWDPAEDGESEVSYILYKDDDDKVYSGSKLTYKDADVEYPNEYSYYLVTKDQAGNKVESNEVSEVPVRLYVTLETNLLKQQETKSQNLSVNLKSEINSKIEVSVYNQGALIDEKVIEKTTSQTTSQKVSLSDGVNEIRVKVTDEFGNQKQESYFVTYTAKVVEEPNPISEPVVEAINKSKSIVEEESPIESKSFWIWVFFWLIIIIVFIWYFIFNENRIKKRLNVAPSKKRKTKKQNLSYFLNKRRKEKSLNRDLAKVRAARIQKQNEIQREKRRTESLSKRPKSELERQKLHDLASRREISIPFSQREKARKRVKKIRKETSHDISMSTKEKAQKPKFFESLFLGLKSKEKQEDEFSKYLHNRKKNEWESARGYVAKPEPNIKKEEKPKETSYDKIKTQEPSVVEKPESKKEESVEEKPKKKPVKEKLNLDDYLNKRTRNRRFLFAQKEVDRDLKNRK